MTKLETLLLEHPEMTPVDVTRVQIAKVSDPVLRAGLEAVVDLIDFSVPGGSAAGAGREYMNEWESRKALADAKTAPPAPVEPPPAS